MERSQEFRGHLLPLQATSHWEQNKKRGWAFHFHNENTRVILNPR